MHLLDIDFKLNNLKINNYSDTIFEIFFLKIIMLEHKYESKTLSKNLSESNKIINTISYRDSFELVDTLISYGKKTIHNSEMVFNYYSECDVPIDYKIAVFENIIFNLTTLIDLHNKENNFLFPDLIDRIFIFSKTQKDPINVPLNKVKINKRTLKEIYKWYDIRKEIFTSLKSKAIFYKHKLNLILKEPQDYKIKELNTENDVLYLIQELIIGMDYAGLIDTNNNKHILIKSLKNLFGIENKVYISKIEHKILERDNHTIYIDKVKNGLLKWVESRKKNKRNNKS
jgi:hypothetical protein